MAKWVAVSYGALDVSGVKGFDGVKLLVTPIIPSIPLALSDQGARFWRSFTLGEVEEQNLTDEELAVLHEMDAAGIISSDVGHPHRQHEVRKPWLISPMHELVYALVANIAEEERCRLLFIKGPVLHLQNLRQREHSGDVDLIVDVKGREMLIDRLREWGWLSVSNIWDGTDINHSRTLRPEAGWGCEIDAHIRMPGIGVSDETALSMMMVSADSYEFAGVEALVPCQADHAILAALHVIRPHAGVSITPQQNFALVQEGANILRLAGVQVLDSVEKLGSIPVLWPLMEIAFPVDSQKYEEIAQSQAPIDWFSRSQPSIFRYYLNALKAVSWHQRPKLVFRILWPGKKVISQWGESAGLNHRSPTYLRVRRLMNAITGVVTPRKVK